MLDFDELVVWIVSAIFLGFLLSVKIVWPFLSFDWAQVFLMIAFSLVMFFVFIVGEKIMAHLLDCKIKIKWLSFRQYWFDDRFRFKWAFPLWILLPLLLFLISAGKLIWTAVLNFDVDVKSSRIKKRWYDLDELDIAKISIAGPIASLVFGILLRIVGWSSLAVYPFLLAFLTIIPFGQGLKILMGSRIWAVFMFVLSGLMFVLSLVSGWLATIVISVLATVLIVATYYVLFEQ